MQKLFHNILQACLVTAFISACSNDGSVVSDKTKTEIKTDTVQNKTSPVYHLNPPYAISLGDLNKDGSIDTVWISTPLLKPQDEMDCIDSSCTTFFQFYHYFTGFSQDQAVDGVIGNAGDLDDDGICEIYFVPDWFTSSLTSFNVYTYKNNTWKKIASGSVRREGFRDENDKLYLPYSKRIIKHNKEYFEIIEDTMDEDTNEKLVPKKFYFNK